MSVSKWEKDFDRSPAKTIFKALVIVFLIGTALSFLGCVSGVISMPFRSAKGVAEKTLNPDNVIGNYEWFKKQHEDIKAITLKIDLAQVSLDSIPESLGDRADWHRVDREEYARQKSILDGLKYQREDMVAKYNARSRMANRSIFKTGDTELPQRID